MKNTLFITLLFSLFLVLAVGASAALTVTNPTLGGTSQAREVNTTQSFTVTNTGSATLNSLAVTCTATDAKYLLTCTGAPASLTAGAQATVTVSSFVPKDFNAVDNSLHASAFKIGTFSATGNDGAAQSTSADVNLQAENKLRFRKGKVTITGAVNKEKSFSKSSKVNDLRPGDKVKVEVDVGNDFGRSTNVDFNDVSTRVDFSNDGDLNVGNDDESFSLNSGDKETAKFNFDINDDASRRSIVATIKIDGKDDNGARHGEEVLVTLEVDRDPHDLVLRSVELAPSKFPCKGNRNGQATGTLLNRGRIDEDEAGVEVKVDALGLSEKKTALRVDQDDTAGFAVPFSLPADAKPGVYNVDITTLYDNTVKSNIKTLQFTVEECREESKTQVAPVVTTPVAQTPAPVVTTPATSTAVQKARVTSQFSDNTAYTVLLGVGIVVVLVLIVAVLAFAFRKR